ncbi:hypothetical protein JCM11251_000213 [Rhodosporidiobolus azoricus]
MVWDGPRTRPTFWTPSIPPFERRLPFTGPIVDAYRSVRLFWVLCTLPAHLFLVALSCLPLSRYLLPSWLYPGKKQHWRPQQRLVYPILRRFIWAICDIGSPGALTPSEAKESVWWGTLLEWVTVVLGGGARVDLEVVDVELPARAKEEGWVKGDVVDPGGLIDFRTVPMFFFERAGEVHGPGDERWKARGEEDRIVLYFVGGGFVTGNPTEGSRCFKLARETGLRVVGANFRKATTPDQAFPAALQDALTAYAHLVVDLEYRDIVLSGDSAGAGLAVNLLQYLSLTVSSKAGRVPHSLVLPSGLLLYSPWSDLTASTYEKQVHSDYEDDIICAGMATNSIRAYLLQVNTPLTTSVPQRVGGQLDPDSVFSLRARHPWFSPCLPEALPNLTAVAKAYFSPSSQNSRHPTLKRSTATRRPLRFFITTGTAELFFPEVHNLIDNLRAASRAAAVEAGTPGCEPFEIEAMEAEGEVHAFPLVPEWVSPNAGVAIKRIRRWLLRDLTSSTAARPSRDENDANENTALLGNRQERSGSHSYHIPNSHPRSVSPAHSRPTSPAPLPKPTPNDPDHVASPPHPVRNGDVESHTYSAPPRPSLQDDLAHPQAPGFLASVKNFLLSGWLNVLLIAVPLSFASHFAGWGSTADFIISFIAIIPLASLLGDATEQCSIKVGQTIGGLLNATFGNAVELIVAVLALKRGELRIVQTSLLGSILSNLLLVLGCSFLAGGIKFKEQTFQMTAAQASSSLMVLAVATLVIPAAYHGNNVAGGLGGASDGLLGTLENMGKNADLDGLLKLSRGTAIVLLFCYASYLYFQLRSHAYLFEDPSEHEEEEARMNIMTATGALVVVTVVTSFCADYLVGAIDEFAQRWSIPKAFIGLILLPIVGNAAEHVTSVWMAAKGKMELTIGVAVGSSIQIAVGLIPILVLVGWIIDQDLTLFFQNFETIVLFVAVLLVDILVSDGRSNYLEGLMLIALYIVIALAFWVS